MNKAINAVSLAIKVAELALLIVLAVLCVQMRATFASVQSSAIAFSAFAGNTDRQLNGTATQHGQDGAISSVRKAVDDVRAGAVIASRQETKYYSTLQVGTDRTLSDIHVLLAGINQSQQSLTQDTQQSLQKLNLTLDRLPAMVDQGMATMKAAQGSLSALQGLIDKLSNEADDPEIKAAVKNLSLTSGNVQQITLSLEHIMQVVDGKITQAANPSKKRQVLNSLLASLKIAYYLSQLGAF